MKVKILKSWIYRGQLRQPKEVVVLPEDDARRAEEMGVASPLRRRSTRGGKSTGSAKSS